MSNFIHIGIAVAVVLAFKALFLRPKKRGGVIAVGVVRRARFPAHAAIQAFVVINVLGAVCSWISYQAYTGAFSSGWAHLAATFGAAGVLVFGGVQALYGGLGPADRSYFERPDVRLPAQAAPAILALLFWLGTLAYLAVFFTGETGLTAIKSLAS